MKRVFKVKDDYGGYIEVQVLEHNNQVAEDLIWLHLKKSDGEEYGLSTTTGEAVLMAEGLLRGVNELRTYNFPTKK